ncbi:hypothetical protein BJY00DRAFT_311995 [Aspergillus carlsbadensis]|nr:hypothetical protein BJY00DRAFT_311995 [Aspergillus carlsbadensis]
MPTHVVQRGGDLFLVLRHPDQATAEPTPQTDAANEPTTADAPSPRRSKRGRKTFPSTPKTKKRNYGPKDHRIRVSSKKLIGPSPFFRAALTGGWKETAAFQESRYMDVGAPDWDIDALLVVMRLLHNNPRKLPKRPSFELLTGVSIIADYYLCRDYVLRYEDRWKNTLLQSIPSRVDVGTLITGLWVALFFGSSVDFRAFSIDLLERSDGALDSGGLPLPQNILDTISDRRRIMLRDFITTMWHYTAALYNPLDMDVLNRFIIDNCLIHAAMPLPELRIDRLRREVEALDLPITWLRRNAIKQLTPEGLSLSDWV